MPFKFSTSFLSGRRQRPRGVMQLNALPLRLEPGPTVSNRAQLPTCPQSLQEE